MGSLGSSTSELRHGRAGGQADGAGAVDGGQGDGSDGRGNFHGRRDLHGGAHHGGGVLCRGRDDRADGLDGGGDDGSHDGLDGGADFGSSAAVGDGDGNTGSLASGLDRRDGGGLVIGRAGTLNAGLDGSEEGVTLLAVAREVGKRLAAVAGERADEASQLDDVSKGSTRVDMHHIRWTYSALRDVVELGAGDSGQGDDGGNGEALHFCGCFGIDAGIDIAKVGGVCI